MNWTTQQDQAITARGRSVIVSAAAGSGKTAVLVERLLRILSDTGNRVRADSIVVVTFTNDAAAQMKRRLTSRLTEKLDQLADSGDTDTYDWLLEQRAGLSNARICTIHSFCFDLIREYAENCHVSPYFTIAETAQVAVLRKRALQKVLEDRSKRTDEMELLFSHLCTSDDSELERLILSIADYMESLPFRKEWVKDALRCCTDPSVLLRRIREDFCQGVEEVIALVQAVKPAARAVLPTLPDSENRYLQKTETDIAALQEQIKKLWQLPDQKLLADPTGTAVKFKTMPRPTKKDAGITVETARDIFIQCNELYKEQYKKLKESYLNPLVYYDADMQLQAKLIPLLLEMTEEYLDALWEEKQRQNVLGFADAEELALGLLGYIDGDGNICRTELAEALSKQISLIMVDEYQDSNNKQDCLFKLLSRDVKIAEDGLHYGSNAFLVGDVKQSIYTFRQANPENFRRAIAESTPLAGCAEGEMARIYLNQNFRSAPGVLDFVNALFGRLMTAQCGEVLYNEDEKLNFGSEVYTDAAHIRTQILLPEPEEALPDDWDEQAECVADTIDHMLQTGVPVLLKDGEQRPCEEGDFCVLIRSTKTSLNALTDAFRRRQIPVVSDGDAGLLGLPEIHLILNLLRIVDNPLTDAAMAAVLCSPIGGFTAEDLALLKVHAIRRSRLYLRLRLIAGEEQKKPDKDEKAPLPEENTAIPEENAETKEEAIPEELKPLQKKCKAFLKLFSDMRQAAEQLPLEDCIQAIYDLTDMPALQGIHPDAEARRAHLEDFMKAAGGYRENADLSSQSCLSGFLRYLDRLTESGKDLDVKSAASEQGSVCIKTIHKSKGLEYPFVFLVHPEVGFNTRSDSQELIHAEGSGLIGLHLFDRENYLKADSVAYRFLLNGRKRKQKSEEMRLLYVALTRAEQQLFVVMDTEQSDTDNAPCNLGELLQNYPDIAPLLASRATSVQDWLYYFLLSSGQTNYLNKAIREGISTHSALADYCVWTKNIAAPRPDPEQPAPVEIQALPETDAVKAFKEKMQAQLKFSYDSPFTKVVSKNSVTHLAHPENSASDAPQQMKIPEFTKEGKSGHKKALTGAVRGTAVHKILQYIDFEKASADPAAELQRLHEQGFLNEAETHAITPESLAVFLGSKLYKRMAASDNVQREKQLFVQISQLALPEGSELAGTYGGSDGVLIGTMDLLFREADGWVLVDYKTDYAREGKTLLKAYSLQLGLYQKAAELILGEKVKEAYLYSFTLGEALPVKLDEIAY